jgi:hypothetical protein
MYSGLHELYHYIYMVSIGDELYNYKERKKCNLFLAFLVDYFQKILNSQLNLHRIFLYNLSNLFFVFFPAAADNYDAFGAAELVSDDIESIPAILGLG